VVEPILGLGARTEDLQAAAIGSIANVNGTVEASRMGTGVAVLLQRKDTTMNADVLKGQWHQLKGEVKSKWGKLTDDDLDRASGDAEKLIGRIQERYGYARDQAKREVDDFFAHHSSVQR
jgi:uncharacterized protein YjbJ (UPF0337 family)